MPESPLPSPNAVEKTSMSQLTTIANHLYTIAEAAKKIQYHLSHLVNIQSSESSILKVKRSIEAIKGKDEAEEVEESDDDLGDDLHKEVQAISVKKSKEKEENKKPKK